MRLHVVIYFVAFIAFLAAAIMAAVDREVFIGIIGLIASGLALFVVPQLVKDRTL